MDSVFKSEIFWAIHLLTKSFASEVKYSGVTSHKNPVQRNPSLKTMLKIKQKIRSEKSSDPWSGVHLNGNMKNSYDSGKSRATTASPKPSFRAPWEVGNAVVGWENAGWTTSKSGHPCLCQNCSQGLPAEKTGRGSLLNHPSCPPWWPNWSSD